MKIAVVHYHLRKGGVTRVIENAVAGLEGRDVEIAVLAGEAYDGDQLPLTRVVEGLNYRVTATPEDAAELHRNLVRAAETALGGPPDVWHIHNHSLGKNVAFPAVLDRLLRDGARVLLQIHDFAEDGRPVNYERQRAFYGDDGGFPVYPAASQIHYATLNQRDAGCPRTTGLGDANLHLLPNSISPPPLERAPEDPFPAADRFILYPTRGIRRKNLGEIILLSALAGPESVFASTLRPDNPEWLPIHEEWERFVARHRLPVHLAFGETSTCTYPQLMDRADTIVTTSVAEGFGLAFLEPWLGGKTVVGRNLPGITGDFGIDLGHLYDQLSVPLQWIDRDALAQRIRDRAGSLYRSYQRPDQSARICEAMLESPTGQVDFGKLDEPLQRTVIEQALEDPDRLARPRLDPLPANIVDANREAVASGFSNAAYGARLHQLYQTVAASNTSAVSHLDADALLDAFLDPVTFTLLRT